MSFNQWLYGKYGYHTLSVFAVALSVALLVPHIAFYVYCSLKGIQLRGVSDVVYWGAVPVLSAVGLLIFALLSGKLI